MRALVLALIAVIGAAACGGHKPIEAPLQPDPPKAVATTWDQLHGPIQRVKVYPEPGPPRPKPPEPKPGEAAPIEPFDSRPVATEFAPEVGKPIDRARLRGTLDRALAIPGVAELALRGRQLADGVELMVDVTPQPLVHGITVHDPKGANVQLEKPITLTPGATLDPEAIDRLTAQIADALAEHGFAFAAVTWTSKPTAKGDVDLDLTVTTGPVVTVASVDITGVKGGKRDELLKTIKQSIDAGQPWLVDHIERALLEVTAYYFDRGYVNAAVDPPAPPPAIGGSIPLVIAVREGDRFTLGKLTITGGTPDEIKKYTALAKLKIGAVFSRHDVVDAMNRIRDAIKAAGKPEVDVTPMTDLDAKKKTIALTIEIKPH